jgi:hypothetical protein
MKPVRQENIRFPPISEGIQMGYILSVLQWGESWLPEGSALYIINSQKKKDPRMREL